MGIIRSRGRTTANTRLSARYDSADYQILSLYRAFDKEWEWDGGREIENESEISQIRDRCYGAQDVGECV